MKLWPIAPFFHSLVKSGNIQNIAACHFFTEVQEMTCCNVLYVPWFQKVQEMTCCNVLYVPWFQKWVKKGAIGQSFIWLEITKLHCSMSFLYRSTRNDILQCFVCSLIPKSTRNDMLQCFVCSLIPKVSEKKGATGQSFIRKEITSYRIGTLIYIRHFFPGSVKLYIFPGCNLKNLQCLAVDYQV